MDAERAMIRTMSDYRANDVKLLSENPQDFAKGDGDEPVQAYIAAMPDWKSRVGRHLDGLIDNVVPEARKPSAGTPVLGSRAVAGS